jgi:purine-binding chemotaxis protein CheW
VDEGRDAHSEPDRQLIAFSLHGEQYALPIASVREIIRYTPPQATGTAHGLIQGMINLRGRVLPVVDLSSRLGRVIEVTGATRILVIEVPSGVFGLIVDAVEGVMQIPADRLEDLPGAVAGDALGDQIAAIDDQLVMLIDPERALGGVLSQRGDIRRQGATPPPPSRRRSAATPQAPRPRRNRPRGKDGGE